MFFFRIHVWGTYQSISLWKYRFLFCTIDRFLMGHTNNSMSYFTVATPCVISMISYWSGSIEQKVIPEFVFKWNWKIRADYILKCTYSHALWYHIGSGPFDKKYLKIRFYVKLKIWFAFLLVFNATFNWRIRADLKINSHIFVIYLSD